MRWFSEEDFQYVRTLIDRVDAPTLEKWYITNHRDAASTITVAFFYQVCRKAPSFRVG